jgi:hypothetical protein
VTHARHQAIRAALAAVTPELTPAGDSGWRFTLLNGAPHIVTAKIDNDWLVFEAEWASHAPPPEFFWDALVRNASLGGLAKLVLTRDGSPRLRAEIPESESLDLSTRVRETCGGLQAGWTHKADHASTDLPRVSEAESIDLKGLCTEAGWLYAERGGRKLAVELEVPGGFCQALLSPAENGIRISCEVATIDAITEECRQAIAGFLLAASGLVRMGRASVITNGTSAVAQFEVVFGSAPSPLEISNALESLSVSCSLCGEEIKTLKVPAIAERYLALRGWAATPAARPNERTVTL